MLPVIVPLLVLQLALMAVSLYDLSRKKRAVREGSKGLWAVLIVFVNRFMPQALNAPAIALALGEGAGDLVKPLVPAVAIAGGATAAAWLTFQWQEL